MLISYNEACGKGCSTLENDLILCEKVGFDYIEIRLDMLKEYLNKRSFSDLRGFFNQNHLKPHALNAVYIYSGFLDENDNSVRHKKLMEDFQFACKAGNEIGSHYIIVVPPLDPSGIFTGDLQESSKDCIRILKQLSELARPWKMNLCFELVGLKKSCVRSLSIVENIVSSVNEDNVGYVFDSYNIYLNDHCNDFLYIRNIPAEKIFAVHLMSADDVPDTEMGQDKRCFPGHGVVNTDAFLKALKATGYQGMVSVETFRPEYWSKSAEWVIENAYITTKKALQHNGCL